MNEKKIDLIGNELAVIIRDGLIEQIPLAGSIALKILNLEDQIKQKRILQFLEDWIAYLKGIDQSEIDWEKLSSSDFFDTMSCIFQRVQQTSAKEKLHRFTLILTEEILINSLSKSDFKDTYLDLILRLNEDQIKILLGFKKAYEKFGPFSRKEETSNENMSRLRQKIAASPKAEDLGDNQELFLFYIQDLISKSLLYDESMGRMGSAPFKIIGITPFGLAFLQYVETSHL